LARSGKTTSVRLIFVASGRIANSGRLEFPSLVRKYPQSISVENG
jgi:hypothetical protein